MPRRSSLSNCLTVTIRSVESRGPRAWSPYKLCIYDGTASLISSATVPAGGFCGGKPCWRATSRGFKYVDKDRLADGIYKMGLREGLEAGAAKIFINGKGADLDMPMMATDGTPTIALFPPVTVVLKNSDNVCWRARYNAPAIRNVSGQPPQFKDRDD